MSNRHRGPSIYASYQVLVHMAKRFQKRRFLEIYQSKQELPVADMFDKNRAEMSNLYKGPSIDAS